MVKDEVEVAQPSGGVMTGSVSDLVASLTAAGTDASIEMLVASARLAAMAEALSLVALAALQQQAEVMADGLAAGGGDDAMSVAQSSVAAEVAVATPMSPRTAEARLVHAAHVAECLPRTWTALAAGDLDPVRVRRIADGTVGLDPGLSARVEDMILDRAVHQTPTQLARAVTRARLTVDPDACATTAKAARKRCSVSVRPNAEPGLADLVVTGPADLVAAAFGRIDGVAREAVAAARKAARWTDDADVPTLGEERARAALAALAGEGDAVADLAGVSVELNVVAPAGALLGCGDDADSPAELAGVGFIPAPMARELAADARWRRWVTAADGQCESVVGVGRDTYRPSAALADLIRARDRTCRFPRCSRRSTACDLDHTVRYPDGPTSADNLAAVCRRHHRLKHEAGWSVEQTGDATLVWRSPMGSVITERPDPR